LTRFWIYFEVGPVYGVRTVDMAAGDLLAGFDPIDAMWHELELDQGPLPRGVEMTARLGRSQRLEEEAPAWLR